MQDLLPPLVWLVELALAVLTLVSAALVLERAGERRWAVLVPIYNAFALARAAGRGRALAVLLLVPCVNLVALGVASVGLARRFERGAAFGLGLAYLPFVFYPLLARSLRDGAGAATA